MLKIAVFSYDAGGSELIASLEKEKKNRYRFFNFTQQDAPFLNILKTEKIYIESLEEKIVNQLFQIKPDLILTGTSWQTNLGDIFLKFAKDNGIKSVSFVDHWTPYKSRFREYMPDFIATFDKKSTHLAIKEGFLDVVQIKNYHLKQLYNSYLNIKKHSRNRVLFLSEPTSNVALKRFGDKDYWGFNEIDVFNEVKKFATNYGMELVVRLHPSDNKDRYKSVDKDIKFSCNNLLEDIALADIIIGIDTIALYYAYIFGKKTIAFIPSNKRKVAVNLPKENIKHSLKNIDIKSIKIKEKRNFISDGIDFDEFVSRYIL